jgi:hypothetical protein
MCSMYEKVTKGNQRRDFFTIPEYERWLEETPNADKWDSKYFKVSSVTLFPSFLLTHVRRVWERVAMPMPAIISVI